MRVRWRKIEGLDNYMIIKYYNPSQETWVSALKDDGTENENFETEIKSKFKSSLQMPNIMVLAGSGTSLGPIVKGPSMWNLWELCTTNEMEALSKATFIENGYDLRLSDEEYKNIELSLLRFYRENNLENKWKELSAKIKNEKFSIKPRNWLFLFK